MRGVNKFLGSSQLENFLFGFTRFLALGVALVGLMLIAVLMIGAIGSTDKTYVSLDEVAPRTENSKSANNQVVESTVPKVRIPSIVSKHLSGDNEKVLHGWLESLDEEQQELFIGNLVGIIEEAESKGVDVIDAINAYKTLKLEKLSENPFVKYEQMANRAALFGAIFGLVVLVGLMSLILVVLAIERNTRQGQDRADASSAPPIAAASEIERKEDHTSEDITPA